MKTELEVARDAVRAALGDDVADALEWAAAAVRCRDTLLSAAKWAATEGGACVDCGQAYVHDRRCPTASLLHDLDAAWSRAEVDAAHAVALEMVPDPARLMCSAGAVVHQSGPSSDIALCGASYSAMGYPGGAPDVTCAACLERLFPLSGD